MEELGVTKAIEFSILPYDVSKTVPEIIHKFVMEQAAYIDFIFVGNNGADFSSKDHNKYLGSVANELIRKTKINIFFMA